MSQSQVGPAKRRIDDLALLGGSPTFGEPLHVGRPNLGDRQALHRRLDEALDRRWLSNDGPLVREFERRLAEAVGVRHVIAVTNATSGLVILARAMGLTGEVIVPSFTFVATAHALSWIGLQPVFCDLDPRTLTIDPGMAARLIGPRTSAILGVHLWGRICDCARLDEVAAEAGIPVVYDAAHAFGCSQGGQMAGALGTAEVFSFHATKVINSFEGGAICTDQDDLADRARMLRNFGIDWRVSEVIGTNGKMHEMSAAMGLTSLEAAPRIMTTNRRHWALYAQLLDGIDGISLVQYEDLAATNAHYVVMRVGPTATLTRDQLQRVLWIDEVRARDYFHPGCHRLQPYKDGPGVRFDLPVTEKLSGEALALPTGTAVGEAEIAAVCALIRFALDHGSEIVERLGR